MGSIDNHFSMRSSLGVRIACPYALYRNRNLGKLESDHYKIKNSVRKVLRIVADGICFEI